MYFPYLRGRQFELIALRELVEKKRIGNNIFPIIEPVKVSSTLLKTLEVFRNNNKKIGIIMNPEVGSLDYDELTNCKNSLSAEFSNIINDPNIKKAYHLSNTILEKESDITNIILIAKDKEIVSLYNTIYKDQAEPIYTLLLDESDFRRTIRNKHRVLLVDNFNKQEKNADYENTDEFLSRDHLFYKEDGYVGFSDFSVIGDDYSESGFAPFAVAIHIVFLDKKNELRIRHFVSDTNDDYSNTARKFYEALAKLIKWDKEEKINTFAMEEFHRLYDEGLYPGLGSVKKLSIMHHIELISNFLDKR